MNNNQNKSEKINICETIINISLDIYEDIELPSIKRSSTIKIKQLTGKKHSLKEEYEPNKLPKLF